jgi:hypothetical protein
MIKNINLNTQPQHSTQQAKLTFFQPFRKKKPERLAITQPQSQQSQLTFFNLSGRKNLKG